MEVKVRDIVFGYDVKPILNAVSFTAKSGSVMGIIGPNGAGKSTLFRVIGKILKPSSGKVFLDGMDSDELSYREYAKKIAAVGQQNSIYFSYTVEEVVAMGRTPYLGLFGSPSKKDQAIIEEAMVTTGVIRFRNKSIMDLSSGESQRVFIARALAQQPEVLMLDEPTSHLDVNFQMEICKLVRKLSDSGMTVLMILHDLNLAARVCDEIAILSEGKILTQGQAHKVITADNIKDVYGIDAFIETSPIGDYPLVLPIQ